MSESLQLAFVLVPTLIVAIVFHEVAHGWAALALGDPTAKEQRRLSLNPIRHVDPVGTVLVPGALALMGAPVFGWAKPVPVDMRRLNNPRLGMMAVAAAGPATNFLLAFVGAIAFGLSLPAQYYFGATETGMPGVMGADGAPLVVASGLFLFVMINLFIALFNLLPIPPFDGSHIVEGALPRRWAAAYGRLRPYGMALFFGLVAIAWAFPSFDLIGRLIGPPVNWVLGHYLAFAALFAGG